MKLVNMNSIQLLENENQLLSPGGSACCPAAGLFQCGPGVRVDDRVSGASGKMACCLLLLV